MRAIFALGALALAAPALSHGGGLNAEGCHNDRKNGGYHCHRAVAAPAKPTPQTLRSAPPRTVAPAARPSAKPPATDIESALKSIGGEAIRQIHSDICFPATADEYEALGKNAILMLEADSVISTELPLRSAYVTHKGVRIPLQRIALLDKQSDASTGRSSQVAFYLLPIQLMKADAHLAADFTGERKAFGIMTFSLKEGLSRNAPAFARLDEYNTPADADMGVVARVLSREYPDYIK